MKNSAWYNKFWHDKMLELTIEENGDAAWQKMQGLLDQHIPAAPATIVTKPGKRWWVKLISIIAVITAVALLYYAGRHLFTDGHQKNIKQTDKRHAQLNADSVQNITTPSNQHDNTAATDDGQPDGKMGRTDEHQKNINKVAEKALVTSNILANNVTSNHNKANKKPSSDSTPITANGAGKMRSKSDNISLNHNNTAANHAFGTSLAVVNEPASRVKNKLAGSSSKRGGKKATVNLNRRIKNNRLSATGKGTSHSNLQKQRTINHYPQNKNYNDYKLSAKDNQHSLTDHPALQLNDNSSSDNAVVNDAPQKDKPLVSSKKTDTTSSSPSKSTVVAAKPDAKTDKSKDDKAAKNKIKSGNSKFELDEKIGLNTSGAFTASTQNNNFYGKFKPDVFVGIAASYRIHNRLGIAIGVNILSPKLLSGSYTKSNLSYTTVTTVKDTSKTITHNSGKITIKGTRKVYSVDVPIVASYKVTNRITVTGGPVISIPVRAGPNKNTLGTLSSSADTTTVKTLTPYVTGTTINNKLNFSITAGVKYNVNRLYIEANYLHGANPYTISSSLGSGKIYYNTIQIGIGFRLFKSKK